MKTKKGNTGSRKIIFIAMAFLLFAGCSSQEGVTPQPPIVTPATLTLRPTETSTLVPATKEPTPTSAEIATVTLRLVTGNDGTMNNPVFEIFDTSGTPKFFNGAVVFSTVLDKNNDLRAGHTDSYDFKIHAAACQLAGWHLHKTSEPGGDDPWLLNEIYVYLNGRLVYYDTVFGQDEGPITLSGKIYSGNWTGTAPFKTMCGK